MSSSLRQRSQKGNNATAVTSTTMPSQQYPLSSSSSSIRLDAASQAFPQQSGPVQKLSMPTFFLFLPSWMQRWIFSVSFLSFLCPTWKTRHLVLLGSYLYRFETAHGTLKGSPVLISSLNVHVLDDMDDDKAVSLAVRWASRRFEPSAILCLRTLTQSHYYACASSADARVWLTSICDAQQEAVRRSMGHVADAAAVPAQWRHWDVLGRSVAQRKERIRRRMAAIEMTSASTEVGGLYPRGFYG